MLEAAAWLPAHACTLLWTPDWRLEACATSFCSKYSKWVCTHTNTAWFVWQPRCSGHGHGTQQFQYGTCGCYRLALSNSVKVKGFAMSGILKHFSERGLWVWTCEICWARGCSSLCPCADSPGAPGAHIQGLCPRKAFPANCLLTTGRLREACFISYLLTLQDSKENTKGARRQSRVHSILKILLP